MANQISETLQSAEIFQGLTPQELDALREIVLLKQYTAGERIFHLGDEAHTLLVVTAGTVALTLPVQIKGVTDEVTIEEKGAGSVIAWSALVPPHKFTLGAKARTHVDVASFERETLASLFAGQPHLHLVVTANLNCVIASRITLLEALVARDLQRWIMERSA